MTPRTKKSGDEIRFGDADPDQVGSDRINELFLPKGDRLPKRGKVTQFDGSLKRSLLDLRLLLLCLALQIQLEITAFQSICSLVFDHIRPSKPYFTSLIPIL